MELKYRPEIDGLRTVAILPVLIYHAEFTVGGGHLLKGGFLGVDVFFVISGFLITSLIISEHHRTGTFSIANFYQRRARRILPALLIVMLAFLPLAWRYLLPEQLLTFSKSIISSIIFGSNFYWHSTLQEYGAESSLLEPFLHTWSLSVEEQYYILFPLLLAGMYRWRKGLTIPLLSAGLLLSWSFSAWMAGKDASFSFYMLPSRFWELLAGGLLANVLYFHPQKDNVTLLNRAMPITGLLLIVCSIIFTELDSSHLGLATLMPVIGTILIIWFANEKDVVIKVLSSKLFVGVGLISYSLYLWHYPIFAFGRIIRLSPSVVPDKLSWLALTFTLSLITYFAIERPARNRTFLKTGVFLSAIGCATAMVVGISVTTVQKNGFPSRLPPIIENLEANVLKSGVCEKGVMCSFNTSSPKRIFLVGDSHMVPLEKPLLNYAVANKFALTILNDPGCQYILNLNRVNKKTNKVSKAQCTTEFQNKRRDVLLSAHNSIVIIGGRLPLILSESRFNNEEGGNEGEMTDYLQYPDNSLATIQDRNRAIFKEFKHTVMELVNHGHKVVLVYPIPEVGWNVPEKILQLLKGRHVFEMANALSRRPVTTSYEVYLKRTKDSFSMLDSVRHANLIRVYPHELFCNTSLPGRCITHDERNAFYRDDDHLSDAGTGLLMELLGKELGRFYSTSVDTVSFPNN